eukprot:Gregarina_sp_Poly_1__5442@NODE_2878_length_1603_cov_57_406901_g254_i1_p2_GENE_NODE_2878_length_1603_cov_57_406901_g254_i1NODE_2878_length_1603_cov_57_406901_g254_i1_p2_ORF_typecomplete_len100_score2_22AIB/PF15334_6/0_052_NODE_2878_length_1603_cov_57_406901_g254_i110151314
MYSSPVSSDIASLPRRWLFSMIAFSSATYIKPIPSAGTRTKSVESFSTLESGKRSLPCIFRISSTGICRSTKSGKQEASRSSDPIRFNHRPKHHPFFGR